MRSLVMFTKFGGPSSSLPSSSDASWSVSVASSLLPVLKPMRTRNKLFVSWARTTSLGASSVFSGREGLREEGRGGRMRGVGVVEGRKEEKRKRSSLVAR